MLGTSSQKISPTTECMHEVLVLSQTVLNVLVFKINQTAPQKRWCLTMKVLIFPFTNGYVFVKQGRKIGRPKSSVL